jgi:dTMP kinase
LQGKFITFEGIDGSGKSTQLRMLASELRLRGYDVLTTAEPGGTSLGRRLRETFLETEENVSPMAELLLFAADRSQHVEFLIKPSLADGKIVISDRFADSTFVYQGAGRGFEEKIVNQVINLATGGLKPDLTIFFDLPVAQSLKRLQLRTKDGEVKNRMDKEKNEFYERVRSAYIKLAEKEKKRFQIVDATKSVSEIHTEVLRVVDKFFSK